MHRDLVTIDQTQLTSRVLVHIGIEELATVPVQRSKNGH